MTTPLLKGGQGRESCPWQALADAWLALIAHRANVAEIMARRHLPVVLQESRS